MTDHCCGLTPSEQKCPHGRWIWSPRQVLRVAVLCFAIGALLLVAVTA